MPSYFRVICCGGNLGYKEFAYEDFAIQGGGNARLRLFEWTPPDGVAVTQAQLYYAISGRGFASTATTPSTNFENIRSVLISALPVDRHRSITIRRVTRGRAD